MGFINERGLFPGVLHNFKFCALTVSGMSAPVAAAVYSFWSFTIDEAHDDRRCFRLSVEDLVTINPIPHGTCVSNAGRFPAYEEDAETRSVFGERIGTEQSVADRVLHNVPHGQ